MITAQTFPTHSTLVFHDTFGVTRLTLPDKVKHLLDYAVDTPGSVTALSDDLAVVSGDRSSKLVAIPALASAGAVKYIRAGEHALSHDGQTVYRFDIAQRADGGLVLFCYEIPTAEVSERTMVQRNRYLLGQVDVPPPTGALDLGRAAWQHLPRQHFVWPDGRFVSCTGAGLLFGSVATKKARIDAWVPVQHGFDPAHVSFLREGDHVWLLGLEQDHQHAGVVRFDRDGNAVAARYEAIEAPAVHAGIVARRVAHDTIVRHPFDDASAPERFTLTADDLALVGGVEPDAIRLSPALPRTAEPDLTGQVMLLGDQVLYLPWHGEVLLNLTAKKPAGRRIARKLAAAGFDARSEASRTASRLRSLYREAGANLKNTDPPFVRNMGGLALYAVPEGMLGLCVAGVHREHYAHLHRADPQHPVTVYEIRIEVPRPITAAEARAGLALLARHGISAVDLVAPIDLWLESHDGQRDALVAPDARSLLAEAIVSAAVGEAPREVPIANAAELTARLARGTVGHIPTRHDRGDLVREVVTALLA